MDTVRSTANYRLKCLQIECETTRRLITEILSNNLQVLEDLQALKNDDGNFVDECCDYQHLSQINILQANLTLQKFLKTPVPVRKNFKSINTSEQLSIFNSELNSISSPCTENSPLSLMECTRLDVVNLSVCKNGNLNDEQVTIQDLPKIETEVNIHSDGTLLTVEPEKQIEEIIEKETLNNGSVQSVQVPSISEELIKTTFDFAQVPFKTENDQTTTKSDLKDVVEEKVVVPDKNVCLKEPTRNYADILKKKEPNNSSNVFYPDFASKKKCDRVETWPALKLTSNTSNKFSCKSAPNKNVKTEITTKPNFSKRVLSCSNSSAKERKLFDHSNCLQTSELKCSTNAEIFEEVPSSLVPSKQNWWKDFKSIETPHNDSSLEPVFTKPESTCSQNSVPQTWEQLESCNNSETNSSPPLESQVENCQDIQETNSNKQSALPEELDSVQIESVVTDSENHEQKNKRNETSENYQGIQETNSNNQSALPVELVSVQIEAVVTDSENHEERNETSENYHDIQETNSNNQSDLPEELVSVQIEAVTNRNSENHEKKNKRKKTSESSDSPTYYSTLQQSKSVCDTSSQLKKSTRKVLDSSAFSEGENHAEFLPNKKTLEWEANIWGRRRKIDNNILNQLKGRDIVSIEERHRRSIPRARMPDISMKPSCIKLSQTQKSILKTDSEEEIDDILDENNYYTMIKEDEREVELEEITPVVPKAIEPQCDDYFLMSDIRSPGLFYIQIANEISVCLDELETQMKSMFKNNSFAMFSSKFEAKKEVGNFFCIEVNEYCLRVEVIDWYITSHKTNVYVQSIDYGGYYEVNYHALRPLPTELYSIPRIAQRCHLIDLYPINSSYRSPGKQWERHSSSIFINLCGDISNTEFKCTTVKYCNIRKSYGIDFKTSNGESISNILVKKKLAIHIVNKKSDFFENPDLINDKVCLDLHPLPTEQIWNAYWYNEHITRSANRNSSYNSSSYTGKRYTNTNELVCMQPDRNQDLPSVGEQRRVMITHVVDVETFYGHIDEQFDDCLVHPGESLHNLHEYMNRYNMIKKYTCLTCTPAVGQLVIAPHPIHLWSRAQVRQIGVPDKNGEVYAELFYIDYGCVKWVPLSAVRNMVKNLNKFPCLAIEFKMFNIEHRFGASRKTEKEFLKMYLKEELFVVIKAVPGHVVVQLLDQFKIDIGETLINHGIGQWKKEHIFPNGDSDILID